MRKFIAVFVLVFFAAVAVASDVQPLKAGPKDKCAVCGMFVAKYPDFAAQLRFRNGSSFHFDGAKDLFKFYVSPSRYAPGRKAADIAAVFVTNYYDLTLMDGFAAYYVVGSDVYGPMGRELIALASEAQARQFMKDHKGKAILRFADVTSAVLATLE